MVVLGCESCRLRQFPLPLSVLLARYVKQMFQPIDPLYLAKKFHRFLPARIRQYLNGRGIADSVIDLHLLGWNGERITIPIFDREGRLKFFKLAKDPEDQSDSPKMLTTPGAHAELYGWERVLVKPCQIVICEGEFDRLALESTGIAAVTSTAGASGFRVEWAETLKEIPEVYVCFDRDDAGQKGAQLVCRMIPHAKLVELPEEVGKAGDVTDFFVRLGRSREDFLALLEKAKALPTPDTPERKPVVSGMAKPSGGREVDEFKSAIPMEDLVQRRLPLRPVGQNLIGHCPFHEDRKPSFVVFPRTQTFHCFGCKTHGDLIEFLMKTENLTFKEALDVLRKIASSRNGKNHQGN